jgi:ABC-type multidrug transport system ATPase subunit
MARTLQLAARGVTKKFGLRTVFSKIGFTLHGGDRLGITGRNGSGKSTLMKLIAGVAERTSGEVDYSIGGASLRDGDQIPHLGFVAPYLQLYTEFSAWEHVALMQRMRGLALDERLALSLFERFGIANRRHEELRTYSSGMLQRVKFICALVHSPAFLLLDEPMTNFDRDAIDTVRELVIERSSDSIILLATNDADDLSLATHLLSVETARFESSTATVAQ